MHPALIDIQRRFAKWRFEHAQVAQEAARQNLPRTRFVAGIVAVLSALHLLMLAPQLHGSTESVFDWKLAQQLLHLGFGLSLGLIAWAAHRLRYSSNSFWGQYLPLVCGGVAMTFAVGITAVDQWITPSITPFLISTMALGLAIYLRPSTAAGVYAVAFGWFSYALGQTQPNAEILLSNRVNGLAVCVLAWCLSLLMWRNFTTVTLQQAQLEKINTELQVQQKALLRLTRLDGLTGLYNRSTFTELTRQELARAKRQGSATTLLLLDLDFFKRVNDTWGHPAGDAVLKNVAAVASNSVRSTDLVGRLGGEEFIILLPNTSLTAARKLAEKLRANLEMTPTVWEQTRITTTVSIGLASSTAAEEYDFDHLYTQADKALYTAKDKGRNRVI